MAAMRLDLTNVDDANADGAAGSKVESEAAEPLPVLVPILVPAAADACEVFGFGARVSTTDGKTTGSSVRPPALGRGAKKSLGIDSVNWSWR